MSCAVHASWIRNGFLVSGSSGKDSADLAAEYRPELLGGVTVLRVDNPDGSRLVGVPYFAWDNREQGSMQVWMEEQGV